MIYTIVPPVDEYTIETDNFLHACLAVCVLGQGGFAMEDEKGMEVMPLFLFGGYDEWFIEHHGGKVADLLKKVGPACIANVLKTIVIGNAFDREEYQRGVAEFQKSGDRLSE